MAADLAVTGLEVVWSQRLGEAATHLSWYRSGVLAAADAGGEVVVLSGTGERLERLTVGAPVTALRWSPDGSTLAVADQAGTLRLHRAGSGVTVAHRGWIAALAWHPSVDLVAVAAESDLVLHDAGGARVGGSVMGASAIHDLAWARAGTRLAVGTTAGLVWCTPDDVAFRPAPGIAGGAPALRLATDARGERLAVATLDAVELVEASGRERVLTGYLDPVPALAWDRHDMLLAAPGDDEVTVWALPAGSVDPADDEPLRLLAHHDTITSLAFAPWGDHLATAALDHLVVWWPAGALDDPAAIDLGSEVLAVAWHPSRPLVAAATRDGDVVVLAPLD